MEIHQLECFVELSKFQNVSLTADHLNMSQPALSKTISLLESELGVKLFDRVGRRIQLNDRGRYFAKYATQALEALREGTQSIKELAPQPKGNILIGLFAFIGLLADCIREFSETFPQVRFELFSSKTQYTIENFDRVDFVLSSSIGSQAVAREGIMESIPVAREKYLIVAAPEVIEQYAEPGKALTLSSLHRMPFIAMANNLLFSDITYSFCLQADFIPNVLVTTNDFASKLHMAVQGIAGAFIPESCVPVFKGMRPDFLYIYPTDIDTERTVYLSRKNSSSTSEAVSLFWEWAKDYFSEMSEK